MATHDKAVTIAPYFKIPEGDLARFKAICEKFVQKTQTEEKALFYGFSFNGNIAHCRECYADADALLAHLENVGALVVEALSFAELDRLEIHGIASEIDKVKGPLAEMNPQYFELEYGFRR